MKVLEIITSIINVVVMGSLLIILTKLERRLRDDKRKENRAEAEGRTMSGYIQWLITKDIKENTEE